MDYTLNNVSKEVNSETQQTIYTFTINEDENEYHLLVEDNDYILYKNGSEVYFSEYEKMNDVIECLINKTRH